jgi:tetratricopeptide (TPR) repeat protein
VNPYYQRAVLLFGQARHELAEEQLRQALAAEPRFASAHALLGLCLAKRERFDEAEVEARQAVHLGPDLPFGHYALASILEDRQRLDEAAGAVTEALRLDPEDADYHALHAQIRFKRREWPLALAAAEGGLKFDPEHVACNNLRAMALVKLGRKADAGATIAATLAREPENSVTHANRGWTLLEQGERKRALEHFRESMRLDPANDWARSGIVEALKAGNPVYALMLRYFLWMQRLSRRAQWLVVLGGYFGNRMLGVLGEARPEWRPWILPLRMAYLVFALLTWLADPIFNLLLRLNRYGRHALSERQTRSANWVGLCLLAALLFLSAAAATGWRARELLAAATCGALALPVAGVFKVAAGWPRRVMTIYSAVMAVVGLAGVAVNYCQVLGAVSGDTFWAELSKALFGLFLLGFVGCFWVVNGLAMARPKR